MFTIDLQPVRRLSCFGFALPPLSFAWGLVQLSELVLGKLQTREPAHKQESLFVGKYYFMNLHILVLHPE